MNAALANLPPRQDFLDPYQAISSWEQPRHPNIHKVRRDAKILISRLEYIQSLKVDLAVETADNEQDAERNEEESVERALEILHAMRTLYQALTAGIALRRVQRDLKRHAPDLLSQFEKAVREAVDQVAQMRAFLAFIVDEDDDAQLGIELIPDIGAPREPEPSKSPPA